MTMTLSKILLKCQFTGNFLTIKRHASLLYINEEVRQALFEKKPVVALESAVITHGMKYPNNINTVKEVEDIIRAENAVPATIGVVEGKIKVGLSAAELVSLTKNQHSCVKIGKRDLPFVVSHKLTGGTTVSSTIVIADKVGIPVFVTGGIGGVHRGGETTMDISTDLIELGRTSIAVISSGIKSILDTEKTLEYLETQGVAVAVYGPTKDIPGFYSRTTGIQAPYNVNTPAEAANLIKGVLDMMYNSGILIAVPVPEDCSIDLKEMETIIKEGLKAAKQKNINGKDVTPFLLNHISKISDGRTLKSNEALLKNNAMVGGKIAVELSKLKLTGGNKESHFDFTLSVREERPLQQTKSMKEEIETKAEEEDKKDQINVVIIGGSNLDFVVHVPNPVFKPKAVFFTCIDSRMIPTRFTETCVGDMFVVRNAGNVIPNSQYYSDEVTTNEPAALELGCVMNDVRHIIVCGHSDCKAMNLLYSLRNEEFSSQTNRRISPLRAWMCAHASSSLQRFLNLEKEGMKKPLVFHAETPLNKFVAYIDPEDKFRTEDKLSQDDGTTVPGKIRQSGGGVGRNIAEALGKLRISCFFISAVADELAGSLLLERTLPHLNQAGILKVKGARTGACLVLCNSFGECLLMVGDMNIHKEISIKHIQNFEEKINSSALVVLDGNLSNDVLTFCLQMCHQIRKPVWFEPTDSTVAGKLFLNRNNPPPQFISPNIHELRVMFETISKLFNKKVDTSGLDEVQECVKKGYILAEYIDNIIITLGKKGVVVIRKGGPKDPFFTTNKEYLKRDTPISHRIYGVNVLGNNDVVNVSGAGDCFASGFIAAMLKGNSEEHCLELGAKCATASLKCSKTVPKVFLD